MGDLLPSRAVTFSIFDPRGAPIASAPLRIDLRDEVETSAEYLYSDEKGAVRVKLSPDSQLRDPFDLRIEVNGGDHAGCVLSGLAFGSLERLELGTVTLTTPREDYDQPLAAGFVRTPEGTAVPDLKASFYTDAEDPQTRSWPTPRSGQVVVEADGRFAAYGQEGTKRGSLQFTAEGREGVYLTNIDLPETGLDVVMARLLELRGRLVVPEGWPAPNEFGIAATGGDVSTVVRVKQDGTFSAPLPLNLSEFEVRYPMGGSMRVHSESFTIGNDDSVDVGTIELDEVARLYEIRVTDPLGEPIRNEPLRAELDGETLPWTFFKTDAQGLFRFVAANDITEVSVGLYSAEKITIDLVSPPERLELPRP